MTKEKETFGAEGDKGEMIQHRLYMIPENTAECLIWGKKNTIQLVTIPTEWVEYLALVLPLQNTLPLQ